MLEVEKRVGKPKDKRKKVIGITKAISVYAAVSPCFGLPHCLISKNG